MADYGTETMADSDLDYCLDLTRRSGSNLWLVGRALPKARREMFVSAYASMRVVDDFVDDEFAVQPAERRAALRQGAHARVANWRQAVESALAGAPEAGDAAALDPPIARALTDRFHGSDIGAGPWAALAEAMHRDVDERPFSTWADFEAYCEGATVAPASIFLYVLAADVTPGRPVRSGLPAPAAECARDMAVFCYLVHIARDLLKDAAQGANLITLPDTVLAGHGLTRDDLAAGAGECDPASLKDLIVELTQHATPFRERGEAWRQRLTPALGSREAMALRALLTVYGALHDGLLKDPGRALSRDPAVRERLRREALGAAEIPV